MFWKKDKKPRIFILKERDAAGGKVFQLHNNETKDAFVWHDGELYTWAKTIDDNTFTFYRVRRIKELGFER